jgi:hypothetical protein
MKKTLFIGYLLLTAMAFAQADSSSNQRSLESPFSSPPFPGTEWTGPTIGVPADAPDYALQKALGLANSRVKIYGWASLTYNASTSKSLNAPAAYCIIPNSAELGQVALRIERQPNTVQTDHFDWGFRLSNMYGLDYRYTFAKGWFSNQYIKQNKKYGYDLIENYAMLYFPKVAEGLVMRIGRYISPPDIEAQLAPDNLLFSHSLMFSYDPFTMTGVQGVIRLSKQLEIILGAHAGNDLAPWTKSSSLNGQGLFRWTSMDNNNSIIFGINSLGAGGKYKINHDNLQMVGGTWGHRFSKSVFMMTDIYYEWERDAAMGGSASDGPVRYGAGGGPGPIIPGLSKAIGAVNYFQIKTSGKSYISIRNDYLNDKQGWRTGYPTIYSSHTMGFIQYFTDWLCVRPEIRYDRNYTKSVTPYDNGVKKNQVIFGGDLLVRF